MSGVDQVDTKPADPSGGHISLKVKGQEGGCGPWYNFMLMNHIVFKYTISHTVGRYIFSNKDGNEVIFRIKRSTQLKKLMNAYCERQSVDFNSIAFLFDGRRLRGEQTPDELEMEEGDEIDAMLHQTGGRSA